MKIGTVLPSEKEAVLTIDELVILYEESNQAEGKSPKTVTWYREMLALFSNYCKKNLLSNDISVLTIDKVRHYILYLRQKPKFQGHPYTPQQDTLLSPRTLQCHCRCLKAFASWLYAEGYTEENFLGNLKLPKAPIKVMVPLTSKEIKQTMGSINKKSPTGVRNHSILGMLLDTGLRASEAANITLGNLNLKDGFIKVTGKGSKERVVPIGEYTRMILWSYINKARPKPTTRNYDSLFLSRNGNPITVNTIKLIFARLAKSSGVTRLHAHLCRHTFAINYILNGGDIFSLREILGHTTLEMVNHYLHFTSSQITAQHHKYSPMDKLQSQLEDLDK